MEVKARIKKLRELMKEKGLDAYVIPSSDAHQSEYVADHWQSRSWISGFTGSAGTVVITAEQSGLWTDGRYFIQAEIQLKDSGIKLFKMNQPGVPTYIDWLAEQFSTGSCVGFDGRVFSRFNVEKMSKKFDRKGIKINDQYDLIDRIWSERPALPMEKVFIHQEEYAGRSVSAKLKSVREKMQEKGVDYFLLSSLDDLAWLYNIRGSDILHNPVALAYGLLSTEKAWLFIDKEKLLPEVEGYLNEHGVTIESYQAVADLLGKLAAGDSLYYDPRATNNYLYNAIPAGCEKVAGRNITTDLKAVKNETEIVNLKECQIRDGVAMVKFLYWLKQNLVKEEISELTVVEKLKEFRSQQEKFIGPSFDPIVAYREHAAMMHYKATDESNYQLAAQGMLLIDSGGQYLDGTTDLTRTIVLGQISAEEKHDFTLALKGHIALSQARFLHGATGSNLDVLARRPLWEEGLDYKCGTGHGVGFFLNVHEGPQSISPLPNKVKLDAGMIITNEPGVYKDGRHGIRIENVLLVQKDEKTEFGQFMKFETISYCPIDLAGINPELLNTKEKQWLNDYHQMVYQTLAPRLEDEERQWLAEETRRLH